jgi:hypothetical protein
VDDLALQVALIDDIEVDQTDMADPGSSQVECQRRS